MEEFKKVTREQAEQFAAQFFGRKIEMVDSPIDEFVFREGVVSFKVFKKYGRVGETSYPFEYPFGQIAVNGYVVAGVQYADDKDNKGKYIKNIVDNKAG